MKETLQDSPKIMTIKPATTRYSSFFCKNKKADERQNGNRKGSIVKEEQGS